MKYKATMTPKGQQFRYVVTDEAGKVVSKRTSKRGHYVACTAFGDFYFGRRDLIGKGEHGRQLNFIIAKKALLESDPDKAYRDYCDAVKRIGGTAKPDPKDKFIADELRYCANMLERFTIVTIEK